MTMYEKYCQLGIDGRRIGLEKGDLCADYFCTPINATVIGWENSIHYCFIKGYRDMVFAVNPGTCVDKYVYPLAMNFKDFLRLILNVEVQQRWSRLSDGTRSSLKFFDR